MHMNYLLCHFNVTLNDHRLVHYNKGFGLLKTSTTTLTATSVVAETYSTVLLKSFQVLLPHLHWVF